MLFKLIFWLILSAYAEEPNHEIVVMPSDVIIYVDEQNESTKNLSNLVSVYARVHKNMVKQKITKIIAPDVYNGRIKIYNTTNVSYINDSSCNYKNDAIACGVRNNHWTIVPSITIEELHANFNLLLFNEDGLEIASASIPIWGYVQLIPQFKRTVITENSMYGKVQREIFEQSPPKRKEVPPLVTSKHVSDVMMMLFLSIDPENI